jgi:hypothetical protein
MGAGDIRTWLYVVPGLVHVAAAGAPWTIAEPATPPTPATTIVAAVASAKRLNPPDFPLIVSNRIRRFNRVATGKAAHGRRGSVIVEC